MTRYAVIVELYPNNPGEDSRFRLHAEIFPNREDADDYVRKARRQNLPFKSTEIVELRSMEI